MDIRTGEIIKDRGVLSDLPKRCNFGDFADKDDDPTINADLGDEVVAEDEGDNDEEDEDGAEEYDASPAPDGLVSSQITRLAPLRPATSSSDADDLRTFLKAEAIRRELDGGDDSSEEEFNILPPRSTPARRTMAPARRTPLTARAKPRPLPTPALDTESEDEFAIRDSDRDEIQDGYLARRTPSPEVPASMPSPPSSSSPGPSSSFSLPSSPLLSRAPLSSNGGPRPRELFGSPTPRRQRLSLASRKTLEASLDEIDIEFPPPQPRAPSIFGGRPPSAFIIDRSLTDVDAEDERPYPSAKATTDPKPVASEPRPVRKNGSALISKRPVPFVLIETKRPTPYTPRSTTVASGSTSTYGSTSLRVDETAIEKGTMEVKSPSQSPARSDSSPKAQAKPRPKPKGKRLPTRLAPSDDERGFGSEPYPARRTTPPKSSPGPQTQVTTPESHSKRRSTRKSTAKPKSTRPTRLTVTSKSKSKTPRKLPEQFVDSDGRGSPPLPPSPSPAPPTRPRIRRALKRKRIVSSGSSSREEPGSPGVDPIQCSSPSGGGNQDYTITSEAVDVDRDNPEAGALSFLDFFCRRLNRWIYYDRWIETPNTITISHQTDDGGCTCAHERHFRRDVIERRPERGRYPEPHGRFIYPLPLSPAFACGIPQPNPPTLHTLYRAPPSFPRPHRQLQSWSLSEPWSQPIRARTVFFLPGSKCPSHSCSGRDPARRSHERRSTAAADGSNRGYA